MTKAAHGDEDSVDRIVAAWQSAVPDYRTDATHVFARIQHIARFYEDAMTRVAKQHGMAAGDVYVLLALRRAPGPLTPTELFRELSVTAGAISKRCDRLDALGLVRRLADDSDGRSVKIELTATGRSLIEHEILRSPAFEFRAPYELPDAERAELTHLLRQFLILLERQEGVAVSPKGALAPRRSHPH